LKKIREPKTFHSTGSFIGGFLIVCFIVVFTLKGRSKCSGFLFETLLCCFEAESKKE